MVAFTIPKFFQNAHTHFLLHIDNNIISEEEEIVECAVKCKNPRLFRPGTNYFRVILRGAHLLAHTWASRPVQHGAFFSCSGIKNAPLLIVFKHYTT